MITIRTKQMSNKRWCCYATIDGYDHSFDGETKVGAQNKMAAKLKSLGKENSAFWEN